MAFKDYLNLVPDQLSGTTIKAESTQDFISTPKAVAFYEIAKGRLLNMNDWHALAGFASAAFQVISVELKEVQRTVKQGDFVRIDIPGPGSSAGDGFDWVRAERIKEFNEQDIQSIGLQVRPAANPMSAKEDIAHFYSEESTSTFIVTREGKQLSAAIIDMNIKPNADTGNVTDKIRNSLTGLGAMGIFSKLQWQNLVDAFMKQE